MTERSQFDRWIRDIEPFWDLPAGSLYRLRQGDLDEAGIDSMIEVLRSIDIPEDVDLPKRFVSLIWFIPTSMEWQLERVIEHGGSADALRVKIQQVWNEVERILGLP